MTERQRETKLMFITGIHYAKNVLRTLNNMTFLYDPNWDINASNMATFPVAFFHIKSIHEQYTTEVSKKPMLFYNSMTPAEDTVKGGLLNVVADNIVIQPKTYSMDIIVPYDKLTLLSDSFAMNTQQLNGVATVLGASGDDPNMNTSKNVFSILTLATPYVTLIKTILKSLMGANYASVGNFVESITSVPDYNKNSLERMWQNRSILKFKNWNSWKYKYVAITDMRITKEGTEDGVYEASLTLQELPILTIRNTKEVTDSTSFVNPLAEASGKAIIKILDLQEQVKEKL